MVYLATDYISNFFPLNFYVYRIKSANERKSILKRIRRCVEIN